MTPTILIPGGYGVFGSLLARELLRTTDAAILVAGRDGHQAEETCKALDGGDRVEPVQLDLGRPGVFERAARGCFAVACTAGPFSSLLPDLPLQALQAGAHWLDISDDTEWVTGLLKDRDLAEEAAERDLRIMPGLSTVPALSGVLARRCFAELPDATRASITLFIGNRNRKGSAAIGSALQSSFDRPVKIDLPIGRRSAYRFRSPDSLLLREELGLDVEFRVAFEWTAASRLMAVMSPLSRRLSSNAAGRLAHHLSTMARPFCRFGSDSGGLQVELRNETERHVSAGLVGQGQRLAILPIALALEAMLKGELRPSGLMHPATWLSPEEWIERLQERGLTFYFKGP